MLTIEERLRRVEDQLEIGQLRATYCHLLDERRWDAFVDLFTEDGCFEGLATVQGREQLLRFFGGTVPSLGEGFWHFCTNGTVHLDGDTATGRISMEYLSVKDGISYVSAGHYDDVMLRVDGHWKFKSRRITFYYFAPLSEGFVGRPTLIDVDGAARSAA
jgi:hypothetical protein